MASYSAAVPTGLYDLDFLRGENAVVEPAVGTLRVGRLRYFTST